jgi:hypothetical protein
MRKRYLFLFAAFILFACSPISKHDSEKAVVVKTTLDTIVTERKAVKWSNQSYITKEETYQKDKNFIWLNYKKGRKMNTTEKDIFQTTEYCDASDIYYGNDAEFPLTTEAGLYKCKEFENYLLPLTPDTSLSIICIATAGYGHTLGSIALIEKTSKGYKVASKLGYDQQLSV